jgi:hypothetical protein
MTPFKTIVCSAMLLAAVSVPTFAKSGTISTTKTGTISTTRTGTISTTAAGTISTTRTGTISTTSSSVPMRLNLLDRFGILEALITVIAPW